MAFTAKGYKRSLSLAISPVVSLFNSFLVVCLKLVRSYACCLQLVLGRNQATNVNILMIFVQTLPCFTAADDNSLLGVSECKNKQSTVVVLVSHHGPGPADGSRPDAARPEGGAGTSHGPGPAVDGPGSVGGGGGLLGSGAGRLLLHGAAAGHGGGAASGDVDLVDGLLDDHLLLSDVLHLLAARCGCGKDALARTELIQCGLGLFSATLGVL